MNSPKDSLPTFPIVELLGKIKPDNHPDFSPIPQDYCDKKEMFLRTDALNAFLKMAKKANEDGISLKILSAFRSFDDQKRIWENKWTGKTLVDGKNLSQTLPEPKLRALKILRYSSMPGSSRHHWGTDFDLNSLSPDWFKTPQGIKLYDWLSTHAPTFGFCQPYSARSENRPTGYEEEKWHWSYLPIAKAVLSAWTDSLTDTNLMGFLGSETATQIGMKQNYVLGIADDCKD